MTDIPDDLIERAARAMCEQEWKNVNAPGHWKRNAAADWSIPEIRGMWMQSARAALSAVGYGEIRTALEMMVAWQTEDPGDIDEWKPAMEASRSALQKARGET